MAPNFSHLLKRPAGQAKKPEALPIGDYHGIIKGFEIGDQNKNKTPYARLQLGLMGWPDSVDEAERQQSGPDGKSTPIDLSKRQLRRDMYLDDPSLWRLDEFLRSCGIEPEGRTYEECLPELVGHQVTIEVQQYLNEKTSEIGNQVGKLTGGA